MTKEMESLSYSLSLCRSLTSFVFAVLVEIDVFAASLEFAFSVFELFALPASLEFDAPLALDELPASLELDAPSSVANIRFSLQYSTSFALPSASNRTSPRFPMHHSSASIFS